MFISKAGIIKRNKAQIDGRWISAWWISVCGSNPSSGHQCLDTTQGSTEWLLVRIYCWSAYLAALILSWNSFCLCHFPSAVFVSLEISFCPSSVHSEQLTYAFGGSSTPLSLFVTVDLRGAFQDIHLGFAAESNNVSKGCFFRVTIHEHVIVHTNKRTLLSWESTTQHMRHLRARHSHGSCWLSYPHKLEQLHPSLPQSIADSLCGWPFDNW